MWWSVLWRTSLRLSARLPVRLQNNGTWGVAQEQPDGGDGEDPENLNPSFLPPTPTLNWQWPFPLNWPRMKLLTINVFIYSLAHLTVPSLLCPIAGLNPGTVKNSILQSFSTILLIYSNIVVFVYQSFVFSSYKRINFIHCTTFNSSKRLAFGHKIVIHSNNSMLLSFQRTRVCCYCCMTLFIFFGVLHTFNQGPPLSFSLH